jgi:hypothetical protein
MNPSVTVITWGVTGMESDVDKSKACNLCKQIKPLDAFGLNKNYKSGLRNTCKDCRRIESASYRARYPDKKKALDKRNYEINGDKIRQRSKNYRLQNADELKKWHKEYRRTHKEPIANTKVNWRKANPEKFKAGIDRRRARKANATTYLVSDKDLRRIMQKPCIYCGSKPEHLEHIIPLVRGGSHGIGNLASSCAWCNLSKGSKFITEWRYR